MDLYIMKIGGSVITEKDSNKLEARVDELRRIAAEIKRAKSERKFGLVVVHGAGPFGHKLVSEYDCNNGIRTARHIEGFVRTHNSMEDLNKVVSDVFREQGLLGFPIQPSACIVQRNKKIVKFDIEIIKKIMALGADIIPIMYGDMVVDEKLWASVVSGDAIVPYLARKLKASKVFFGSDVDGIFTADPKTDKDAKLIPEINKRNFNAVLGMVGGAKSVDVTGGMKGKINALRKDLGGKKVVIFNALTPENTYAVLAGKKIACTEINVI